MIKETKNGRYKTPDGKKFDRYFEAEDHYYDVKYQATVKWVKEHSTSYNEVTEVLRAKFPEEIAEIIEMWEVDKKNEH